jgi:cytochrome c
VRCVGSKCGACHVLLFPIIALTAALTGPLNADESDAGKQQFLTSCGACHSAENGAGNRQGPNLFGVYGRRVGERTDFNYSDALKGGSWKWTQETLDPWIENAQAAHPGTMMNYRQANPDKRKLVIDYLKRMIPAD